MSGEPILKIDNLDVHYGDLQAVWDVSLTVETGQIIAIIGANGAGKSTTLRSVAGLMPPSKGRIEFMGKDITGLKPFQIVAEGIAMVPEGRRIFPGLTVKENLRIGAYTPRARKRSEVACQKVFNLFPVLGERANQLGTNLSGGEQQMLAVGRALMSEPKLILFDEISLGLAPLIIRDIYQKLIEINQAGISVVLVEQDLKRSLKASNWTYIFQKGHIALNGDPAVLTEEAVKKAYFGV